MYNDSKARWPTQHLLNIVINDSYFKSLIFNPLCLSPNQDLATSKPTFFPRATGNPKNLDWILLPPSFLDFNVSTSLPQTSPPISKENKSLVNEVKQLSSLNSPISKEISERLNDIIVERIQSTKDRFYKFIAQSRHSPSKAMTLMSSVASTSKRPRIEDADAHLKFWTDHFTHTDSYNHTPCELSRVTDYFFSFIDDKILSSEASSRLSREITTEEVELVIKESPCNSSSGMDGIPYEVYKYAHPAMINLITENFNFYYSKPESLPTKKFLEKRVK